MKPDFSITTPVFNGMPWLPCCVASVADQCRGVELAVEHIIQDGGSKDVDWQEFSNYWGGTLNSNESDKALRIYNEPDQGMYDAINLSWKKSSGGIIAYLNCDEQYLPGTFAKVARYFLDHPNVDLLFGDALLLDRENRPVSYRRVVTPLRSHTRVVHLGTLSCAMFFRRALIDRGFFFDTRYKAIGDAEWVWRVLAAGVRVGILNEPLSAFTLTGTNLGASGPALKEAADWKASAPTIERVMAPWWKVHHWLRKALAGAYGRKPVKTAVYTPASLQNRVPFDGSVSTKWTEEKKLKN